MNDMVIQSFRTFRFEQEKAFIIWDGFMAYKLHNILFVRGRKLVIKPKNKFTIL